MGSLVSHAPPRPRPGLHRRRTGAGRPAGDAVARRPTGPALPAARISSPRSSTAAGPAMRIVDEEVFGPVVAVIPFDTEEEAVRLANASPYGLSGSIWTP